MKEETLSDKRNELEREIIMNKGNVKVDFVNLIFSFIRVQDKEFIKRLKKVGKERLQHFPFENYELFCEDIDKLAGDKLI